MSLLPSEVQRLKFELGFNVLNVGAEPYIGVSALFDQVIQPYLLSGASTTCSTAVAAATSGAPVSLTLTSATGFAALARVIVDVDSAQEAATVQSLSGSAITVILKLAHAGTYPVTVEGGESLVREYLGKCRSASDSIARAANRAGLKSVDKGDVVFFGGDSSGSDPISQLQGLQRYYRAELSRILFGVGDWRSLGRSGGRTSIY